MATIVVECEQAVVSLHEFVAELDRDAKRLRSFAITALVGAVHPGGHRSIAIYDAPDEATMRGALLLAKDCHVWSAITNRSDGFEAFSRSAWEAGSGALALVDKRFPVEVEIGAPANNFDPVADWCLGIHGVRYLHSHLTPDRRRMCCLYIAADVESTVAAYRLLPIDIAAVYRAALSAVAGAEVAALGAPT